ncbi:high mobility group nucleosome-binding domain-containing protein 5 [Lynx canadensis]|uniref:high mobility group nucleosome-binding domain-containing protein 5 n=1 Tax=Lynx canadensis TaxID=61383 RepID=UPI0013C45C67|nr:high mobility group nucleosome-binding domain-containing protein 5 [Lynx canadensis]
MPKRKAASQDGTRQEPKRRSARLSAMPVPITPELKPKRTSITKKMKTEHDTMEKNTDTSSKAIAENKKEVVKEEYSDKNGEAKIMEAPAPEKELEEMNEEKNEDVEEEGVEKNEAVSPARKEDERYQKGDGEDQYKKEEKGEDGVRKREVLEELLLSEVGWMGWYGEEHGDRDHAFGKLDQSVCGGSFKVSGYLDRKSRERNSAHWIPVPPVHIMRSGLELLEVSPMYDVHALLLCPECLILQASHLQMVSLPVVGSIWFLA